eukprot:478089-Prorocentrum_minimum.AAC.1
MCIRDSSCTAHYACRTPASASPPRRGVGGAPTEASARRRAACRTGALRFRHPLHPRPQSGKRYACVTLHASHLTLVSGR